MVKKEKRDDDGDSCSNDNDDNKEKNINNDEDDGILLLADVDDAFNKIVSFSEHDGDEKNTNHNIIENENGGSRQVDENENDDGTTRQRRGTTPKHRNVTLSRKQITYIRQLQRRIHESLQQQRINATKGFRKVITGDSNRRVRDVARSSVKRTVRKVVTGNPTKPIHKWINEKDVVKTVDKFSFVLGVFVLCVTEFMVLQHPQQFGTYYCCLISGMMVLRYYMYAVKQNFGYFLLDFCYLANLSCFMSVLLLPENQRLWKLNFAISNGTLLGALLAWRNSLVFHSLDKVTSIAIHLLPSLLTFIERWSSLSDVDGNTMMMTTNTTGSCHVGAARSEGSASYDVCNNPYTVILGFLPTIVDSILFYVSWQIMYIVKTEIIDRKIFLEDPSIQTSLRWLTRDTKNGMHVIALQVCRIIGVLQHDEKFDPESFKTKLVFWIGQLIFTILTLIPTPLLFAFQWANVGYILFVLAVAVYNGSNYYFEVFAARYIQKLEEATTSPVVTSPSSAKTTLKKDDDDDDKEILLLEKVSQQEKEGIKEE